MDIKKKKNPSEKIPTFNGCIPAANVKLSPRLEGNFSDLSSYPTREFLISSLNENSKLSHLEMKCWDAELRNHICRCVTQWFGNAKAGKLATSVPQTFHSHFFFVYCFHINAVMQLAWRTLPVNPKAGDQTRKNATLPLMWWVNQDTLLSRNSWGKDFPLP